MRLKTGDVLHVFNGRDGEWSARVVELGKKSGNLTAIKKIQEQKNLQPLELYFSPIRSGRIETLIEKAVELGVTVLQPVVTQNCEVRKINRGRLFSHAVEAAEQCERLCVPELRESIELTALLQGWPSEKKLALCTERGEALPVAEYLSTAGTFSFLTGPEGGFSGEELARLRAQPYVDSVSLGPRILRAETAAIAALTCWQALQGDWKCR